METIVPIIVQIVAGVLGGQAVGAVLHQVAMSQLTKIISGAVGGVAGGQFLVASWAVLLVGMLPQAVHWVAFSAMPLAARVVVQFLRVLLAPL